MNSIYFVKGTLNIKCSGYWYSSSGGKGSFGYFSHLKDKDKFPVYPDTQLLGNLKYYMDWVNKLQGNSFKLNKFITRDTSLKQSKLLVSELQLTKASKKIWDSNRFKILPRIEIDNKNKVVKDKMLLFFEAAYLEKCSLEAEIFIGYINSKDDIKELMKLTEEASKLMGASGAFRSRGFGRGDYSIKWDNIEEIRYSDNVNFNYQYKIALKNLNNFRNKRVLHGKYQNIKTSLFVPGEQLKAWIANTYYNLFKDWINIEEYSKIHISNCYPTNTGELTYPFPMIYLRDENNKFIDTTSKQEEPDNEDGTYFSKTKIIDENYFVVNSKKLKFTKIDIHRRFRNVMEDNFKTKDEGGLFSQEYIQAHTTFSGIVRFDKSIDKEIHKRVVFILSNVKPSIGFSIFHTKLEEFNTPANSKNNTIFASEDIPYFNNALSFYDKNKFDNYVMLGSKTGYHTVLKRKKRPIIVLKARSVFKDIPEKFKDKIVMWEGFDINNYEQISDENDISKTLSIKDTKKVEELDLTPSQAGLLRNLKESYSVNKKACKAKLEELNRKFEQWGYEKPLSLKKEIVQSLINAIDDNFEDVIENYLTRYYNTKFYNKYSKEQKLKG